MSTPSERLDSSKVSEAISKWRLKVKENSENAEAHYALGLSYLNSRLRDAALTHLRKASLLVPEVPDIHYNLALTLFDGGNIQRNSTDYSEAAKEIEYALRMEPVFPEAEAFKHFFLARKLDDTDSLQAYAEYERAVASCSNIALIQNNLGLSCYHLGKQDAAETAFRRAIELDPNLGLALSNLCLLCFQQKKYAEGVELGEKAIARMGTGTLDETKAMAHNNLALCYWKAGKKEFAIEQVSKAIALQPNTLLYRNNRTTIGGCFPGHARVLTSRGYLPIKRIRPGDEVVTITKAGKDRIQRVTRVLQHSPIPTVRVVFKEGSESIFEATRNHRLLCADGSWRRIDQLTQGDSVCRLGGSFLTFDTLMPTGKTEPTYNLYTHTDHNFIVEGIPVHNFTFAHSLRTWIHSLLFDRLTCRSPSKRGNLLADSNKTIKQFPTGVGY